MLVLLFVRNVFEQFLRVIVISRLVLIEGLLFEFLRMSVAHRHKGY